MSREASVVLQTFVPLLRRRVASRCDVLALQRALKSVPRNKASEKERLWIEMMVVGAWLLLLLVILAWRHHHAHSLLGSLCALPSALTRMYVNVYALTNLITLLRAQLTAFAHANSKRKALVPDTLVSVPWLVACFAQLADT